MINFRKDIAICSLLLSLFLAPAYVMAKDVATLHIDNESPGALVHRDIFGQFVENIGTGIYGGIWVGEDSDIPNVRGIRSDVVNALKELKVPNVRWPGGCYADQYYWRDGIGPQDQRKTTLNYSWGRVLDSNAFGTHEFMDFVEQIDSEAFLTVNMATGTAREASNWLEYITVDKPTSLGLERAANGSEKPWPIKYLGLGNESWACGGAMTPEMYVDQMKLFTMFTRSLHPDQLPPNNFVKADSPMLRIAVGPGDGEEEYTDEVMKAWKDSGHVWDIEGIGLHRYTSGPKGVWRDASLDFGEMDYVHFLDSTYEMEAMIQRHSDIMDKYDPEKKVMLAVDEWGNWLAPLPGTEMFFLKQQNSLRDAIVAALHINIFARHAERVKLANIAQLANVLQSMFLTEGEKFLLTPTYHVFKMYIPFQDATYIPVTLDAGNYSHEGKTFARVDAVAARAMDGHVYLALVNVDHNERVTVEPKLGDGNVISAQGQLLTAESIDSVNTFTDGSAVSPVSISSVQKNGKTVITLPPKSIAIMRLSEKN